MQPPQVAPVIDARGPAYLHGSVASRSPYSVIAAGSAQLDGSAGRMVPSSGKFETRPAS